MLGNNRIVKRMKMVGMKYGLIDYELDEGQLEFMQAFGLD